MKIAIVHDWLTGMRGGEKCLEVFCRLYPEADLFTLLHIPGKVSPVIEDRRIHTSFLQNLPFIEKKYRYCLPLMPFAIERFDLQGYDLILSSSHCVAKGAVTPPGALHLCYCHTPMRYIWDQYDQYFNSDSAGFAAAAVMRLLAPGLRRWDVRSARRVNHFIANSSYVRKRIEKYYRRDATVIFPPIETKFFSPSDETVEDFFLVVSAFAPYKRVDLAVEAFTRLGYPLIIIGEGQDADRLKRMAGSNIRFNGWMSAENVRSYYARCRALIFCAEEDFGITPLEAQAMGKPVIALGRGGALETVIPDKATWKSDTGISEDKTLAPTGVFFHEQTPDALIAAIKHFETLEKAFDHGAIRNHALKFDTNIFSDRIQHFIQECLEKHRC